MKKQVWGNAAWFVFHTLATKLKPEFPEEPKILFQHIKSICRNLPCPDCSDHATALLNSVNVEMVCASTEQLKIFLHQFHNRVNAKVGNKQFTQKESEDKYIRANTRAIVLYFLNIMESNMNNEKMMLSAFHRSQYMKDFRGYMDKNLYKYNP